MARQTDSDPHRAAQRPGPVSFSKGSVRRKAALLRRYAERPWASGLVSCMTTILVMLPLEYQMPVRTLMLFISTLRL